MSNPYVSLHYNIVSGDYIKGGEASSNIKKVLLQLGIQSDIIKRVCISSYEAEMNIVIHSVGGNIDMFVTKDKIVVVASDKGPGISDIDLAMTAGYSTASNTAREMGFGSGIGLPNIKKSCDDFKIESQVGVGTIIHMVIYIK